MMLDYYDRRAPEYDDWYRGEGLFAARERPGWSEAVHGLTAAIAALSPAPTLDVACGTGFLTQWLPGSVTGLDASPAMLEIARERVPRAAFVRGDALALPFDDASFARLFTGHFYGHLERDARSRFLAEARRVASDELIVVDSAVRPDHEPEEWQERVLRDGSRHSVYKRYFTASGLADELGGGSTLYESPWFVAVSSRSSSR